MSMGYNADDELDDDLSDEELLEELDAEDEDSGETDGPLSDMSRADLEEAAIAGHAFMQQAEQLTTENQQLQAENSALKKRIDELENPGAKIDRQVNKEFRASGRDPNKPFRI